MQTFLSADLPGIMALTEAHGDEHTTDLAGELRHTVRELLPECGVLVKTIGDAAITAPITASDP